MISIKMAVIENYSKAIALKINKLLYLYYKGYPGPKDDRNERLPKPK